MRVQTDTASVLHETIEYIKFLHDQVGVSVCVRMRVLPWFHTFNHSTSLKPEAPALARFLHTNHQKGTDRSTKASCIDIVLFAPCFLQVLSAPYLKNNDHHQGPHLKVGTSVTVQACMLAACLLALLFIVMDHGTCWTESTVQVCWWLYMRACVRAFGFRAQVLTSPRTTAMARYRSRAGGCAWSRYRARSR